MYSKQLFYLLANVNKIANNYMFRLYNGHHQVVHLRVKVPIQYAK